MMRRYEDRGMLRGYEGGGPVSAVEEIRKPMLDKPVDREKTCPLLLRLFYQQGRHHSPMDYAHGKVPLNELQIYTWKDASLKELTTLVNEVNPDTRRRGTYFEFSLVVPVMNGSYRMRDVGSTCVGMKGADDAKTLAQCNFTIGDFVDICVTPPQRVTAGGFGGGGPRRPRPY